MSVKGKIQALNQAIRETIPHMQTVAGENPNAEVLVRAIKFSQGAEWHVATPTNINDFKWTDLTPGGCTDLGKALSLVAEQLRIPPMTDRALPPVLVLVSDGQPTDDFGAGLAELDALPWGRRAVRVAVAIGDDADPVYLERFMGNAEMKPLQANNPEELIRFIRWASTAVLKSASQPASGGPGVMAVPLPSPPAGGSSDPGDVW